ncbi:MAG: GDSL-type esterase/lipase family protein [Bacillota bacterium]|jgi:acyl-CoA thioesterase-1
MKIVCLGDSLTYGYGVAPYVNWISLLNKTGTETYINKGINGDTTGGMLARFNRHVLIEEPQMVIIMGGTNDIILGFSLETIKNNIISMVQQAYDHQIIPILGIPFRIDPAIVREDWADSADFRDVAEKTKLLRNWVIDFCQTSHIEYLDFYHEFTFRAHGEYSSYFVDGLHPNERGQKIIAEIVGEKIGSTPR